MSVQQLDTIVGPVVLGLLADMKRTGESYDALVHRIVLENQRLTERVDELESLLACGYVFLRGIEGLSFKRARGDTEEAEGNA